MISENTRVFSEKNNGDFPPGVYLSARTVKCESVKLLKFKKRISKLFFWKK